MLSANFVQRDPGIGLHICSNLREIHVEIELEAAIISLKIFLVVLIVDSFSEALLSTSPGRTVPANVQITAAQLFFHYRLCKTNYY